ncbi:polyphosphate polymerase domain-containing protein [Marinilabiliaceae bacterium JC017]|nr:polyphosphate polymerase domain-containing protein [Marinilabiliaceae bacterium JC017]
MIKLGEKSVSDQDRSNRIRKLETLLARPKGNCVASFVRNLTSVSLDQIKDVKLFNRVDTKYIIKLDVLLACLRKAARFYSVVEVNNERLLHYNTIYFDTPNLNMYFDHHNGKMRRFKVRYREYAQTGDQFLEIKRKEKGRTHKMRVSVDRFSLPINGGTERFIENNSPYSVSQLAPQLSTQFSRITLVNKFSRERITIDLNVKFIKDKKNQYLEDCAIVEVKRSKNDYQSYFSRLLKNEGCHAVSFSKYCLGIIALNDGVKYNRFKPKLRQIEKLMYPKVMCLA